MGCGGCAKKKLFLKSQPGGISRELVENVLSFVDQKIRVLDLTGQQTIGKLCGVELDNESEQALTSEGSVAVETLLGVSVIGFNIIESIELLKKDQSSKTSL